MDNQNGYYGNANPVDNNSVRQYIYNPYTGQYEYVTQPAREIADTEYRLTGSDVRARADQQEVLYNTQASPAREADEKKHSKETGKRRWALAFALMMVISVAGGFGGGYAAARLGGTSTPTVIYQNTPETQQDMINSAVSNSAEYIAAMAAPSVVEITTEIVVQGGRLSQYVSDGAGSGVIISADGYIVTNHHVIADATKITVKLHDGQSYEATLVGTDSQTDVAVIKINASGLTPAVMSDSSNLKVGQFALAIGNPLGQLGGTVTSGIISALDRDVTIDNETMSLMQIDAAVNPGNSGGGLFNSKGELIGIVNAKSSGTGIEGIGFAIPINTVKEVMEDLISKGYVSGRFVLGVNLIGIYDETEAMIYRVPRLGVYIQAVESGSNAQLAGINVGDCILTFNGVEISTIEQVKEELKKCEVDQQVEVTVLRSGKEYQLTIILRESKPQ